MGMKKYKVVMLYQGGRIREEDDELFDTELEADDAGLYYCTYYQDGGEILNLSNPGDYPFGEDEELDFEVIEVEK